MDIYELLCMSVENGSRFHIDFKQRTMSIDKKKINLNIDKEMLGVGTNTTKEVFEILEELYKEYKYSLPSERSERKRRKYFYAMPMDDLSIEQLCKAIPRELAQAKLEGWLLLNVIAENLKWTDDLGKWYWHGEDEDLIVLKGWF